LTILPIQPDAQGGSITSFTVVLDNFEVIGGGNSTQYQKTNLATPVILDSGTTLTYLPDQIANDIAAGVGASNSRDYGLVVPCNVADTPATINFGFGAANGVTIVAPIAQFVLPFPSGVPAPKFRSNGQPACFWGINPSGSDPNLLGDTFLRSAYVVYNLDGQQIGLAQTNFNATGSNVQEISEISSVPNAATTVVGAAVTQTANPTAMPSDYLLGTGGGSAATTIQGSGTFNLGQPTSSSSTGKKNAANAVQVPSFTFSAILLAYPAALAVLGAVIAVL
jgi:Eukaryotic aspartyl protease